MNIENEIFKKSKFDYDKLFKYGFIDNKKEFLYIKNILNDSFKLEVSIINDKVSLRVIDLELDASFALNIPDDFNNLSASSPP